MGNVIGDMQNWDKIIAHADMDAFYASIEQRDFPELRGKPIAITNGECGSCVITRSYEARRFGVKTGMRLAEARTLCSDLIQCPSRPDVYAEVSTAIFNVLETITPDLEVFSVDEAFLDFSHCRTIYNEISGIGKRIREAVFNVSGITCSVGISGDKTTAKYASKLNKPNQLTIIPPWEAEKMLSKAPVTALCGVGKGIGGFLAQYGVYLCGDMKKIPISVLGKRFGNIGRRIWLMAQGKDPEPLHKDTADPKSLGHGKILPPNTRDESTLLFYLNHMADKVAHRLLCHQLQAQSFFIGLKTKEDWLTLRCRSTLPTNDGHLIYKMAKQIVAEIWKGEGIFQCQITALDPQPASLQGDLFDVPDEKQERINETIHRINKRFGRNTLVNGIRLKKLVMPDVIAPAWRPNGHRRT